MKTLLLALLLLSACQPAYTKPGGNFVQSFPGIAKQEYVMGTEDLPLYSGFEPEEEGNVSYDSVDGRIIDATFYSKRASAENVRKFYNTTLPQLGWQQKEYQIYEREGEILKINILEQDGKTLLKFAIRPS